METFEQPDYEFHAAGGKWEVGTVSFTRLPDGTNGIQQAELNRLHRAIANEICGSPESLDAEELKFLCELTSSSHAEIAQHLGLDESAVGLWASRPPRRSINQRLKKWFWFKLFGTEPGEGFVPPAQADDARFLWYARNYALNHRLTFLVRRLNAWDHFFW